nr:hypothetical protein [Tanacetum cinerariifolium]
MDDQGRVAQLKWSVEPCGILIVDGVVQVIAPANAEQRLAKKNKLKARGTLLASKAYYESLSQEDVNLKFLRSLPSEWRTHTLIWRNKADLEDQSLDDLFNNLKIYEAEVKISDVPSVSTAGTKAPVSTLPKVDNLSHVVIYSFFASQSNSPRSESDDSVLTSLMNESETVPNVFNVEPSTPKPTKDMSQSNRPSAPIIEDWVSDSEDKYEVLTRSRLVPLNAARPVTTAVPHTTMKSPKPVNHVVNKAHSPIRRPINHRPTLKNSNFHQKVTTVKVKKGNLQQALKDKGVIDSGCARHMTRNISYLSDFEEINRGYVAFGGNPKGGKITGK